MSKESKPRKPRSSAKKSELEAKIAELEAKLSQLSSQVSFGETKSAETRPAPKPAPRPAPQPKEEPKLTAQTTVSAGEVAPAYATVSSTGYTGNKYYATRRRLAYHPPDKQYRGESVTTATASPPPPPKTAPEPEPSYQQTTQTAEPRKSSSSWKAKGAQAAEEYVSGSEKYAPRPEPKPAPKPAPSGPKHGTLPAGFAPPKPKEEPKPSIAETIAEVSTETKAAGEVAPAYATVSSTGYTGNKYYATRRRLAYHPPDKQYRGEGQAQVAQVATPEPPKKTRGTLPAGWRP